jgi:hypothetical protein
MFDVVRKSEYWEALNDAKVFRGLGGFTTKALDGLKHIQDAWMLNYLKDTRDLRILEVGGANSRVLPRIRDNELWNLDEFKGVGNGPLDIVEVDGVKLIKANLGDFDDQVPGDYFDIVFSISVIEHITDHFHDRFWEDHARILKSCGTGVHLIDIYTGDTPRDGLEHKLDRYLSVPVKYGLVPTSDVSLSRPVVFTSDMASNSDWGMWRWNVNVPALSETRRNSQSVTLKYILHRK